MSFFFARPLGSSSPLVRFGAMLHLPHCLQFKRVSRSKLGSNCCAREFPSEQLLVTTRSTCYLFAMACARLAWGSRLSNRHIGARTFSLASVLRNEGPSVTGTIQPQKKPIGGFRGGYASSTLPTLVLILISMTQDSRFFAWLLACILVCRLPSAGRVPTGILYASS